MRQCIADSYCVQNENCTTKSEFTWASFDSRSSNKDDLYLSVFINSLQASSFSLKHIYIWVSCLSVPQLWINILTSRRRPLDKEKFESRQNYFIAEDVKNSKINIQCIVTKTKFVQLKVYSLLNTSAYFDKK